MSASLPVPSTATRLAHLTVVAAIASLDAVLRLGLIHPDEHFQTLEPALRQLYGYGVSAWEWDPVQGGIRNWAFPGIVMGALKVCDWLAVNHPQLRRAVIEIPLFGLHLAMLGAVFRFSARRVGPRLALWCVWVVGLYGPILWFAGRTLTESISAPLLVIALERLEVRHTRWHVPLGAGLLLGLAEIFRYGSAAAIAFVLLWLALTRRWRELALAAAGGAAMAGALLALDQATWGFSSLLRYLDFNLRSGAAAARFGSSPWYFYFGCLLLAPSTVIGLGRWWTDASSRAWSFLFTGLGYAAILTVTSHKERRFLYPTLVLLTIAGTPALVRWCDQLLRSDRAWRGWLLAVTSALGLAIFFVFPCPFNARYTEVSDLTIRAGREGKGLLLVNVRWYWSGGFFYIGKDLPWCASDNEADECFVQAIKNPDFDRAITWDEGAQPALLAAGFKVHQRLGRATLLGR